MQYNDEQLAIINSDAANRIVVACPGSGKSATVIGAVQRHLKNQPLDHVCVITFTRKAAAELANRINNPGVEVSTIHSWAYRRLQYFGAQYNFRIQLLEEPMIKDILKKLCARRNQYYINQRLLYSYIMGNKNIDLDEKISRVFKLIAADYESFKRKNKLYDFTDLPLYLRDICVEYDEIIDNIDALFVDEFQDIDPVQLEVFEFVKTKKRMYIGDPKQAIYAFRGACSEVFNQFKTEDWEWFDLSINYRSKQNIIDYTETAYAIAKDFVQSKTIYTTDNFPFKLLPNSIKAGRGNGGLVTIVYNFESTALVNDGWVDYDCETTEKYINHLIGDPRNQILCRSNKEVKKLQGLGIENVSTVHQAKGLEYDKVIVVDFPVNSEEELNISYVAASRAKDELCIIDWDSMLYFVGNCSAEEKNKGNGRLF